MMYMVEAQSTKLSSSGIVTPYNSILVGVQIGMDATNDLTLTIYNGVDNTGTEILPTNQYDASALGLNGVVMPYGKHCPNGIYLEMTCAGTAEVVIDWIRK